MAKQFYTRFRDWIFKGITALCNIMTEGTLFSFEMFKEKFSLPAAATLCLQEGEECNRAKPRFEKHMTLIPLVESSHHYAKGHPILKHAQLCVLKQNGRRKEG